MRDSFIFYRSFSEALAEADDATQLRLYKAITVYALSKEEPTLKDATERIIWRLVKPVLDANWQRFENGCKGGAPIGNLNAKKTTEKQPTNNRETTNKQPNIYLDEDEDKDEENNKETSIDAKKKVSLNIEQRKEEFKKTIEPFKGEYPSEMLNDFFEYWTEPNPSNTQFRREREKSWKIESRLRRWANNDRRAHG